MKRDPQFDPVEWVKTTPLYAFLKQHRPTPEQAKAFEKPGKKRSRKGSKRR